MKKGVIKKIFLCLTFLFLIGLVSAWSVDITKLNNNAPTNYYDTGVNSFSYSVTGLNCPSNYSWIKYSLNSQSNQSLSCGNGELTFSPLSWIEGNNTLEIYVNDTAGTTNSDNVSFWVDSISPILNVLNPLGNIGYTNTNFLYLIAELTETNPGYYVGTKEVKRIFTYPDLIGGHTNAYDLNSSNIADASHILTNPDDQQEGSYTYIVYAKDVYPGGSTIREINKTGVIIRDITAPTITDNYANDGTWINLDQIVTLTPLDLLSYIGDVKSCEGVGCDPSIGGILLSPYQLNYNSDQDTIVRYQVWDLATNPSAIDWYNVKLDKTNPITTDDALIGWQNFDQTITLSPIDPLTNGVASGIIDTFYRINSGSWISYSAPILITDEGINILEYYSTDVAGNIELVNQISVMIDKSLPVSLITSPLASSWHNNDFAVGRTDTDTYSGINFCETRILDNGLESLAWTPTPCNTNYLLDISAYCPTQGTDLCEAQIRSTDNVAWISNVDTRTFSIDTTSPVVDAGLDILTNSPISQDATTSDLFSGIATYSWTQIAGPGIITFGTPAVEDTTIQANADGVYTIQLLVTDNAGNSAFDEISFTWDTTAPVLEITAPILNNKVNGDEIISFTDNELTTPQCSVDNLNWIACTSGVTILNNIPEFALLPEGAFTLYLKDTDLAGNQGTDNETGIIKDTISPNVIISSLEFN